MVWQTSCAEDLLGRRSIGTVNHSPEISRSPTKRDKTF
jgi:hypothetical protein